jgi:hypothetical protein
VCADVVTYAGSLQAGEEVNLEVLVPPCKSLGIALVMSSGDADIYATNDPTRLPSPAQSYWQSYQRGGLTEYLFLCCRTSGYNPFEHGPLFLNIPAITNVTFTLHVYGTRPHTHTHATASMDSLCLIDRRDCGCRGGVAVNRHGCVPSRPAVLSLWYAHTLAYWSTAASLMRASGLRLRLRGARADVRLIAHTRAVLQPTPSWSVQGWERARRRPRTASTAAI